MDGSLSQIFARWRSNGDARLLAEIFDRIAPELLRVAIHLVGEVGVAEDLVQATFLTAIERAQTFDDSRKLEAWLAGILENHARELAREAARTPDPERLERRLERTPLDEALSRELSAGVASAIDELPEPYRRTLLLRVRHGLAPADIAHVLGESPGAVRVRLHRAIELLRKRLPAGLALGALFALEPARGMSSVKGAVLAAAGGGLLVMKKVLIAAALLALLLVAWRAWPVDAPAVVARVEEPRAEVALSATDAPKLESGAAPLVRTAADAAAAKAATVFHFKGQVVDGESGEPLAGATVDLHLAQRLKLSEVKRRYPALLDRDWYGDAPAYSSWPWVEKSPSAAQRTDREPLTVSVPPDAGQPARASLVTAADGSFDFVESESGGGFVCKREGYATRFVPMRRGVKVRVFRGGEGVEQTNALDSLLIRMFREYELHGMLHDEQGERVRERVRLRFYGFLGSAEAKAPPVDDPHSLDSWTVETDADGSFSLRVTAPTVQVGDLDPRWTLCQSGKRLDREGVWSADLISDRAKAGQTMFVVVRRTPVLRVRDRETREPIEDIRVIARGKINGYTDLCGPYFAPKGELRLARDQALFGPMSGFDEEPVEFTVWADGYAASCVTGSLAASSGPDLEVELAHGELPLFEGFVRRAGEPLSAVPLTLSPESSRGWYSADSFRLLDSTVTDAEGCFSMRAPPGFYALRLTVDGVARPRSLELPLARPLSIDLGSEASVRVHVGDSSGKPQVNHVVSLQSKSTGGHTGHTDARGDVTFDGLLAGPCKVMLPYVSTEGSYNADFVKELDLTDGQSASVEAVIPADDPRFAHLAVSGESDLSSWRARVPWSTSEWTKVEPDGRIPIDIQRSVRSLEFERSGEQRWEFSLPKDPPADLVLRIDFGGSAYDVELVDAVSHKPIARAVVVAAEAGRSVSAQTDAEGVARLAGLSSVHPALTVRVPSFEPRSDDLLRWDHGMGACGFEPAEPAASPATRVRIELPGFDAGRVTGMPELRLTGVVRVSGTAREGCWVHYTASLPQAQGTLLLRAFGRTEKDGRYELRAPLGARARITVYDPDSKRELGPVDWNPALGATEETRDLDFP